MITVGIDVHVRNSLVYAADAVGRVLGCQRSARQGGRFACLRPARQRGGGQMAPPTRLVHESAAGHYCDPLGDKYLTFRIGTGVLNRASLEEP